MSGAYTGRPGGGAAETSGVTLEEYLSELKPAYEAAKLADHWTLDDLAEARAEAQELVDYFRPGRIAQGVDEPAKPVDGAVSAADLVQRLQVFQDHFWIDRPQMSWKRTTCDDGLEMVHHDGDTIFFGDANHQDPNDIERFDLIVELANSVPRIIAALRAPATRGEIAETIWRAEYRRATGKERNVTWSFVADGDRDKYLFLADAILSLSTQPITDTSGAKHHG